MAGLDGAMASLDKRDELHRPLGLATPKAARATSWRRWALLGGAAVAVGFAVFLLRRRAIRKPRAGSRSCAAAAARLRAR
jgi:hypothetical protein